MVKIFIDPGHGGHDSGATSNGLQEKNLTLQISKRVLAHIQQYANVEVKMSRTKDVFVSLTARTNEANHWGADYFLSIHINSGGGTGYESYIYSELSDNSKTNQYRKVIHRAVMDANGMKNRGEKKANFHVLRESNMPAMLGENGFIDTKEDAAKMKDAAWIDEVGKAYAVGIAKVFDLSGGGKDHSKKPSKDTSSGETSSNQSTSNQPTGQIATIQKKLNEKYHFSITVDNLYGPETKKALLKAYQTELNRQFNGGLVVDGVWGPKTSAASVNVQKGAKGQLTWVLQALLIAKGHDIALDGVFGNKTLAAVRSFQRASGLSVDGIAGKNTYQALFR